MTRLIVCPLRKVEQVVAQTDAGALVSLLSPPYLPPRPPSIAPDNHLILGLADIEAAREGYVLAEAAHIADFLSFVRRWDRARPMVIHCYAGVSRSPAAAFAAACALTDASEIDIARKLRALSPSATPNRHIVALADALLSREGRMSQAITMIGRGAECFEGEIFSLDMANLELA